MNYWTSLQTPSSWYLISGRQKTFFFCILLFHALKELKKVGDFYSISFFAREAARVVESHERANEAQMSMGGAAHP
jgi:hypothetical protein